MANYDFLSVAREKFVLTAAAHLIKKEYGFVRPDVNDQNALIAYAELIERFLQRARDFGRSATVDEDICLIQGTFDVFLDDEISLPVGVEFRCYDGKKAECRKKFGADLLLYSKKNGDILSADNASDRTTTEKYILRVYKLA